MWLTFRRTIGKISHLFLLLRYRHNQFRLVTSYSIHSKRSILINDKIIPFFNFKFVRFIVTVYFHHINRFIIVGYLWAAFNWLLTLNRYRLYLFLCLWLRFKLKKWWTIITIIFGKVFENILFWFFLTLSTWLFIFVLGNYTDLIIVIFWIFLYVLFWIDWKLKYFLTFFFMLLW